MIRRPLVLALVLALLPAVASAEDLLQTYELARNGDPQLSAAESTRLATKEGAVQARAALLPTLTGSATLSKSRNTAPSFTDNSDPTNPVEVAGNLTTETTTRSYGVDLRQMIYDRSRFTTLKSRNALSQASDFQL